MVNSSTLNEMNVEQAAQALRVSVSRVHQLIGDGRLKARKASRRCWLIEAATVDRYAASDRKPGPRPR